MHRFLLLLTLTACLSDPTPLYYEGCGDFPSRGSYTVTYVDADSVMLSRADFKGLVVELHDAKQWAYCVTGGP